MVEKSFGIHDVGLVSFRPVSPYIAFFINLLMACQSVVFATFKLDVRDPMRFVPLVGQVSWFTMNTVLQMFLSVL